MTVKANKVGLSLSGGGYRAAGFHLGTLKKLHELKLLSQIDVISTISGGSITGAYYCLTQEDYGKFESGLYEALLHRNVVRKVLLSGTFLKALLFVLIFLGPACYFLFTPLGWLFPVFFIVFIILLLKFQFYIFPVSKRIEKIYDDFFFKKMTLPALPDRPLLVIGSTNLQTASPFSFSRDRMGDLTYFYEEDPIKFNPTNFPIARAVMASSCVPFAFTPVSIDREFFVHPPDAERVHPQLVDGGVYDNQGIHKLVQKKGFNCDTVITSDAGGGDDAELSFKNTISLLVTTMNVFMARIKNAQISQYVFDNAATAGKEIAYCSLGWDVENCIKGFVDNLVKKQIVQSVIDAHGLDPVWVGDPDKYRVEIYLYMEHKTGYANIAKPTDEEKKIARNVSTNLTSLRKNELDALIKQAEAMTELQVKIYCPSLFEAASEKK